MSPKACFHLWTSVHWSYTNILNFPSMKNIFTQKLLIIGQNIYSLYPKHGNSNDKNQKFPNRVFEEKGLKRLSK